MSVTLYANQVFPKSFGAVSKDCSKTCGPSTIKIGTQRCCHKGKCTNNAAVCVNTNSIPCSSSALGVPVRQPRYDGQTTEGNIFNTKCNYNIKDFKNLSGYASEFELANSANMSEFLKPLNDFCFATTSKGCFDGSSKCIKMLSSEGAACREFAKSSSALDPLMETYCNSNPSNVACECLSVGSSKNKYTADYNKARSLGISLGSPNCWFEPCQPSINEQKQTRLLKHDYWTQENCPTASCINLTQIQDANLDSVNLRQNINCEQQSNSTELSPNVTTNVTTNASTNATDELKQTVGQKISVAGWIGIGAGLLFILFLVWLLVPLLR